VPYRIKTILRLLSAPVRTTVVCRLFVSRLKPDVFREEIYSYYFEMVPKKDMNYRDIIEISDRIKRSEVKKDTK